MTVGNKSKSFVAEPQLGWQWLGEGEDEDEARKMGAEEIEKGRGGTSHK